eukprot:6195493-Pleurochrysis_carterae.AAC.3
MRTSSAVRSSLKSVASSCEIAPRSAARRDGSSKERAALHAHVIRSTAARTGASVGCSAPPRHCQYARMGPVA